MPNDNSVTTACVSRTHVTSTSLIYAFLIIINTFLLFLKV